MTDASLGTARLDIVVGTEQFDAAIQSAQTRISGMSAAAQSEYAKLNAAEKRRIDSLLKQADTYGKTRAEVILYNAALKGTPTHILDELKNKLGGAVKPANDLAAGIKASGNAAANASKQFNQYGLSAKQQAAALRGVPAQLTDIFTSLASGQRPITVLLQQGGQLKDMFGGAVPAIRALGGAVAGLINPLTIAIGVIAGLGAAWKSAQDEARAFNLAIIQTGGFAGHTADDLKAMAERLDETTGATQRFASEVIAQVEATGRFTGQQVETVSTAITNMAKATQAAGGDANKAIQELTKSFSDLSKDPVDALLKLNETQHFLTQSTLDQVQSLVAQGKEAEAAEVAINALADTTNTRAKQMEGSLNSVNAVWRDMKGFIGEAWDETVGFFRDADEKMQTFLRNNERAVRIAAGLTRTFNPFAPNVTDSLIDNAKVTPEPIMIGFKKDIDSARARRNIKETEEAQREWNSSIRQGEDDAARLKRELEEVAAAGKRLGKTGPEIAAAQADIRAAFARKKPKGPKDGIESATSRATLQALEDQLKKEQGLIANQTKLLEANYSARNISTEKYYAEQKRLAQEGSAAQIKALEGQVAALQSRSLKGKDSINNARELAQKEAELAKARADGATALEVLNIQEAAQLKQRQQALKLYGDALGETESALRDEMNNQVLRISVGEREFEIRSRINQIYREGAKELRELARARDADPANAGIYEQQAQMVEQSIARQVQAVRDGYNQMAEAQAKWSNGALKAFEDYKDAANDVAGQTYDIFSSALGGLEDVLTEFFTKGKADWKGFFDGIAEEVMRFVVRQQLSKVIQKFMPGMGEEDGDGAAALSGAAASLAASATPLMGAAAALSASASALAAAGTGSAVAGATSDTSGGGGWASTISSIIGLFSGNLFAKGGAFSSGIQYFARGDIFNSPTAFGMAGGIGVMGEAGPEAVMPLKRGADGRLGVEVASNQQRPIQNFSTTLIVPDISTRRSQGQVANESNKIQARWSARNR